MLKARREDPHRILDWLKVNAKAGNKVRDAPDPKKTRDMSNIAHRRFSVGGSVRRRRVDDVRYPDIGRALATMSRPAGVQTGGDSFSIGAVFQCPFRHFFR
jgi:hypothetical protein